MPSTLRPAPLISELPLQAKFLVAGYLNHRLSGVRKAMETARLMSRSDPTDSAIGTFRYYRHVEKYLVQLLHNLGFSATKMESENADNSADSPGPSEESRNLPGP